MMKKFFSFIAFAAILLAFTSCLDDDGGNDYYNVGMGTLQKSDKMYSIAFDGEGGTYAVPDSSLIVYRKLQKPGQRVIAMFNVISDGRSERAIRLRDIFAVLTKGFADAPDNQAENEALGNDLANVGEAWIAGGCLNVKFSVPTSNYTLKPHLVNAYDTGTEDSEGYRIIEFRHHLNGNTPSYWSAYDYVSFTLPDAADASKKYVLRYQYSRNEQRVIKVD